MMLRRRDRQVKLSALPLLHLVPNMLTILGLCAGLTAIRYALDNRYELAVTLIGAAVVLDGLDGRSARGHCWHDAGSAPTRSRSPGSHWACPQCYP
jgi:hypothetical protein